MKISFRILFFIFSIFLILEKPAVARVLTWEECVQQTIQSSDDLHSAESALKAADYAKKGSYSNYLPQVSASVNYTYSGSNANYGTTIESGTAGAPIITPVTNSNTTTYSTELTASENLFSGLSDRGKVDQAKASERVSEANLQTVKAQVSYDLKNAFSGLLFAQQSIQLDETILKRRQDNLRMIELRFQNGQENKGSLLLSQAYQAQAKYNLMLANDALLSAQATLAKVLGIDDDADLSISGAVPVSTPPPAQLDYQALSLAAPDYLQSQAQEAVADAGVTIARSGFFPTLGVTGSLSNTGSTWFPANQSWSIGAGISIPLFAGGRDYFATKSANQSLAAAMYAKQGTYKQDIVKIKSAYHNYVEAVQKLEVDRIFAEAASVREQIGRQKYNNGLLTFDDFDIIETDYINRETSLLQTVQSRVVQEAAWEQAQGKGVIP